MQWGAGFGNGLRAFRPRRKLKRNVLLVCRGMDSGYSKRMKPMKPYFQDCDLDSPVLLGFKVAINVDSELNLILSDMRRSGS
jgi:hypothetical protein